MTAELTVFVVDDNPGLRRSLQSLLEAAGLRVETFASAREFLERFDGGRPGCMVVDVRLRDESGLDLQEELRRRRSTLPIIVMTGYGDVRTSVRAFKAGAIDFLQKPVPPKKLLERIRSPSTSIGRHARQRRSVPSCSTASPASRRASGRSWTCWRAATVRKRSPRR